MFLMMLTQGTGFGNTSQYNTSIIFRCPKGYVILSIILTTIGIMPQYEYVGILESMHGRLLMLNANNVGDVLYDKNIQTP